MEDLDRWLTQDDTRQRLGSISIKTLNKYVRQKKIAKKLRPVPGRRPLPLYRPEDVDDVRKTMPAALPVPPALPHSLTTIPLRPGPLYSYPPPIYSPQPPLSLAAPHDVKLSEKVYLTLVEASRLSGLSKGHLLELVADGTLTAIKRGRWLIRRRSLEAL